MRYWFFPTQSGDFRFEQREGGAKLTVVKATKAEVEKLNLFLPVAAERGWIAADVKLRPGASIDLDLETTVKAAGLLFAELTTTDDEWTATRFANGRIILADKPLVVSPEKEEAEPVAQVTTKRPARGCPAPEEASRRASEVLRAFSTRKQIEDFEQHGYMRVIGSATGRLYHVYHRTVAAQKRMNHTTVDTSTGFEVCLWDASVPAEEEALTIKLALEHREGWARSGHGEVL